MATKTAPRFSRIRYVAPAGSRSNSALPAIAMVVAATLAIVLMSVTISAAQAMV